MNPIAAVQLVNPVCTAFYKVNRMHSLVVRFVFLVFKKQGAGLLLFNVVDVFSMPYLCNKDK